MPFALPILALVLVFLFLYRHPLYHWVSKSLGKSASGNNQRTTDSSEVYSPDQKKAGSYIRQFMSYHHKRTMAPNEQHEDNSHTDRSDRTSPQPDHASLNGSTQPSLSSEAPTSDGFSSSSTYQHLFGNKSLTMHDLFPVGDARNHCPIPRTHPFTINANKMETLVQIGACLRNSSFPTWDATKTGAYAIPLFTCTQDRRTVHSEWDRFDDACHAQSRLTNDQPTVTLRSLILKRLRNDPALAKIAFKRMQNDTRLNQISRFIHQTNYDILLLQHARGALEHYDTSLGCRDDLPNINEFEHGYSGGARVWGINVNDETLAYRATLTRSDYAALETCTQDLFQTLYHSFDGDTQAQAFLQNSQEKWKNTLFLDLATEFIWAKIVKFINLSTLQPCTLTGKQRLALPTTESCLQDGTIIKQRPCVRLHDKDIQKITTYMPHSAWFLRYQDTLKNRTNEALCHPIITKKYSPSV